MIVGQHLSTLTSKLTCCNCVLLDDCVIQGPVYGPGALLSQLQPSLHLQTCSVWWGSVRWSWLPFVLGWLHQHCLSRQILCCCGQMGQAGKTGEDVICIRQVFGSHMSNKRWVKSCGLNECSLAGEPGEFAQSYSLKAERCICFFLYLLYCPLTTVGASQVTVLLGASFPLSHPVS